MSKTQFWKNSTVYQIYPRSFRDTDGNGLGDIRGIINSLDYLAELGINRTTLANLIKQGSEPGVYVGNEKCWTARWPNKGANDKEMKIEDGTVYSISGNFTSVMNTEGVRYCQLNGIRPKRIIL